MTHEIVSVLCGGPGAEICTCDWDKMAHKLGCPTFDLTEFENKDNSISPCEAYQRLLSAASSDVIIYIHDDVTIHDPDWLARVLAPFERNEVVAVGLGGATGLGNSELYKTQFDIWNMARRGYASNQTDAEVHGERFSGTKKVAVLDAFFMAVRTSFLHGHSNSNGWPTGHLTHHCLDLWLACEAARAGKETWLVGVNCTHHGGGSSTTAGYAKAAWLQGGSMQEDHVRPHRWLVEEYRDVLPLEV